MLKHKHTKMLLCSLLSAAVLLAGCGPKTTDAADKDKEAAKSAPAPVVLQQGQSARYTPIVAAVKKAGPAVVGITQKSYARDFFGNIREVGGTGSGVIFDAQGYIATNNHVVENAKEIIVNLPDGRSFPGKLLGTDKRTDLAVVKIEAENLPVAQFGDSSTLMVGEPAIAIGNPLGLEFQGSVTVGVISALNRGLEGLYDGEVQLIQTDAAINPGNSGGALVNADGEVVGINSAKIVKNGVEGIGFSIPVNTALPILRELAESGTVAKPYMGVMLVDKEASEKMGLGLELKKGIFIPRMAGDGPAYKAGVRPLDILLQFNGKEVNTAKELRQELAKCKVGDKVKIVVLRGDNQLELTMTIGEAPEDNG